MLFRGRTVAAFLLVAVTGSALVTLTVADRLIRPDDGGNGTSAAVISHDANGLTDGEIGKLDAVFSLIEQKYYRAVDRTKVLDGALSGMIAALGDPYSVYMEKETARHFSESVNGSFTGIGAELDLQNGKIVVVSALKGSPADRAGLQAKDVLLQVNGDKLDGLDLSAAVAKIRGPKGTKAKLLIQRAGVSTPIQLILVRDDIDYETVVAKMLPGGIGKIEIRQFAMNTADRFSQELSKLEDRRMKGLVIDVRNNPGGVLTVAELIAQTFVPRGKPLVWLEDRSGNREQTASKGGGKPYPVAVLINKGSASAAEVLAGALRESGGSVLIGDTSFGKGTVQISYSKPLEDGSQVKMTIAKWLTPDGHWIHEKGIPPDIRVRQPAYYTVARINKERTLRPDTIGEDVRSMQIMLEALGFAPGRTDGYFSSGTKKALQKFQREAGLAVTGVCQKATAERLEEGVIALVRDDANDRQLAEAVRAVEARIGGSAAGQSPQVSLAR